VLEEFVKPLRESVKLLSDLFMAIRVSVASSLGVFEDVSKFRERKATRADRNRVRQQREIIRTLYSGLCGLFASNVIFVTLLRSFDGQKNWSLIKSTIDETEERISNGMINLQKYIAEIPAGHHVTAAAINQTLAMRRQVLSQLKSIEPPFSDEDINAVRSMAAEYTALFNDLGLVLDSLAFHLGDKAVDVKKLRASIHMMSDDMIRRLYSGKSQESGARRQRTQDPQMGD
jgi:hypothetical protein